MKLAFLILLLPFLANAYPDFISYGYRTCITCHYNGQGGGALNDYGRAVWASELTSRALTGNKTADQLGDESGFLGKTELPWYIRPGLKYRGLFLQTGVGSSKAVNRWINMQMEGNLAIHLDKRQEKVIVMSYANTPTPRRFSTTKEQPPPNLSSHEYYLRWQVEKKQYVYIGFMDKFYGLKHPDHTAFNRALIRNSQNDQTHGIAYQYLADKYDITGHVFAGNLSQDKDVRQSGATVLYEYALEKTMTLGGTAMFLTNDYIEQQTAAVISRLSFSKGKSFITEVGLKNDKIKSTSTTTLGYYGFLQGLIGVERGYNFLTGLQMYKAELNASSPVQNRLSVGGLFFPYPRTELRIEVVNDRTSAPANSSPDQWSLQAQVHLAL
ncbi:MAG: hypothetical protein H7256_12355 [Bdellovibrio sp.]|nr:hypothetical protein [Bdellovibrio sp.]